MTTTISRRVATAALTLTAGLALALAAAGCSTYRHEFPNHSPDQVWAAAMSVAQSPDYEGDWVVTENHVWIDDEWARMEIDREIRRMTHQAFTAATQEKRRWQFRVTMEGGDPVVLSFMNRNPTIPGWTLSEAQRYFKEVDAMLTAVPAAGVGPKAQQEAMPPQPEVKFEEPMDDGDGAMDDMDESGGDDDSDDMLNSLIDDGA